MPLHRDIFWVGRQWAVTGFGVQAVDQRLKGTFDIEAGRVWDDGLSQRMRTLAWLNSEDFNKALEMARARFPAPPRRNLPLVESVLELIQPIAAETPKVAPEPLAMNVTLNEPAAIDLPRPEIQLLAMRLERASARFLPQWRVRS